MLRLNRALIEIEVESLSHFLNLAALQVRRELVDLARCYYGQHGLGANHHTDGKPVDNPGGAIQLAEQGPDDLEDWEQFHAAIDELPAEESEVFHLVFYQGLKQHVAAELLALPLRTFKRRLQQAKIRLHSLLTRENKLPRDDKPRATG
jgi:RNA polymerase sigma-70 factor (ECF subfamily)